MQSPRHTHPRASKDSAGTIDFIQHFFCIFVQSTFMKNISLVLMIVSLLFAFANLKAQRNLQSIYDQIKPPASETTFSSGHTAPGDNYQLHIAKALEEMEKYKSFVPKLKNTQGMSKTYPDTIIVGVAPYDTLRITGTFSHKGPIIVALNGVLIIKNANFTNVGDLILFNNGKAFIDSSNVSFPQNYFYQRSLILVNHAQVIIHNTKLSYGGYVHNCVVTDSAQLNFQNVTQPDFMTTGLSRYGSININGTNQAGEFIIQDYVTLNIKNATTALLWHSFPDTSVINWSFGARDTAYNYHFNKTKSGVKGVEYQINADSVYGILWGMMPSSGSHVTISNSKIRTIGLLFDHPHDTVSVSGITNNSSYQTYTLPLSDRTLKFSNCYVSTWSLYVFHHSHINISGCITGEVGCYNRSSVSGTNFWNDGSGGYLYASDTATSVCISTTASTAVRSEKTSIMVFGYSTVGSNGYAAAIDNSFLVVTQSSLPSDPVAYSSAAVLYDYINPPAYAYVDSIIPITGSAWIHRGPTSAWMYFKRKQLFYQKPNDTAWTPIAAADTIPVSNSFVANWNTHGMTPGNYNVALRIFDTWGNKTNAIRQVNLLSGLLTDIENENTKNKIVIYPNPAQNELTLSISSSKTDHAKIEIMDIQGRILLTENREFVNGNNLMHLNTSSLPTGNYLCKVETSNGVFREKIVVVR